MIPEDNRSIETERVRLEMTWFQKIYVAYGLIYCLCCRGAAIERYFNTTISLPVFVAMTAAAVVLTASVMIYNHRKKTKEVNVTCCNIIAAVSLGMAIYWWFSNM